MKNPNVSIIIPAYNAEAFAKRCLDSILHLQYYDWECIVVNDGSTDHTLETIESYACRDARIHIINKQNSGVSTARNAGIEQAKGEWITFVDIDDYVTPDFFHQEDLCTQSELIVKNWQYTDGKETKEKLPVGKSFPLRGDNGIEHYLHYSVFRTPWAKIFRADIIKSHNIHFNPNFKLGEDNLFVLEYLQHINSIIVTKGNYIYERPSRGKYPLTYKESRKYLHAFAKEYYRLGIKSPMLLSSKLKWFISFVTDFTPSKKYHWFKDKTINQMYMDSIQFFNFKTRIKVNILNFINKI